MNDNAPYGLWFYLTLAVLFSGLKVGGVISWPWVSVLSPIWVPSATFVLAFALIFVWLKLMGHKR